MTNSNPEVTGPQPKVTPETEHSSSEIAEFTKDALVTALELAKRTLPEEDIAATLQEELADTGLEVVDLNGIPDELPRYGARSMRTVSEVVMGSKITKKQQRARQLAVVIAERRAAQNQQT
jgi:sugar phosphate isomerase/epimerase